MNLNTQVFQWCYMLVIIDYVIIGLLLNIMASIMLTLKLAVVAVGKITLSLVLSWSSVHKWSCVKYLLFYSRSTIQNPFIMC